MIGYVRRSARLGAVLALMLAGPMPGIAQSLDNRDAWECSNDTCVQRDESHLGQLHGSFEYGANVSSSSNSRRIAELEAQQYRKYHFNIPSRMKIYARSHRDEDWIPADWPGDIGIQSGGPGVELYQSIGGNTRERIEQGSVVPAGAYLEVVVAQSSAGSSAYRTFYPARWWVDVSFRRVKFDEGWGGGASLPGPQPSADTAAHFTAQTGQGDNDDGAGNCRDGDCREPDQQMVMQDPAADSQGDCGDGNLECKPAPDPDLAGVSAADDPAAVIDPQPDCGAGQMECRPDDGQVPEPVSSDEADAVTPASKPNPMDGGALARMVQRELKRLGCYTSEIDGLWGPGSTRAMSNFNHWHGSLWPVGRASAGALEELLGVRGPVCGVD